MTVKGFSDKGLEKLKTKKDVVLPVTDTNGVKVECVYENSFINKGIKKLTVPANYKKIYDNAITASAFHPARHHRRPRRRPDEPEDDGAPDGGSPHDTDEPGDPPHGTGVGAPNGRRMGNHDTEELLPQGP